MPVLPAALSGNRIDVPPPTMAQVQPGIRNQVPDTIIWQSQVADQWCWAACTVMIVQALGFWTAPGGMPWSQCRVFERYSGWAPHRVCHPLGGPLLGSSCLARDCVVKDAGGTEGAVSEALAEILPFWAPRPKSIDEGNKFSDARIRTLIDRGWPVAVLNKVIDSQGRERRHYVLIVDYDVHTGNFGVWDPAPNQGHRVVDRQNWQVIGEWVGAVDLLNPLEF